MSASRGQAAREDAVRFELVEPFGQRFLDRIDATAGPNWMPAARERRA